MSAARKNNDYGVYGRLQVLRDVVIPGSTVARAEGDSAARLPAALSALHVVSVASSQVVEE